MVAPSSIVTLFRVRDLALHVKDDLGDPVADEGNVHHSAEDEEHESGKHGGAKSDPHTAGKAGK